MESVPHLKPLESYSEVKSSTDLLRNPQNEGHRWQYCPDTHSAP